MERPPEERDEVQRLIGLKRHEIPPPGFYRDFSRQVRRRIEAEEEAQSAIGWRGMLRWLTAGPAWRNPNAIIGTGVALLAVTALFYRSPATPGGEGVAPSKPVAAGLSWPGANKGASPADPFGHQDLLLNSSFRSQVGITYRVDLLLDSNAVPAGLQLTPVGVHGALPQSSGWGSQNP